MKFRLLTGANVLALNAKRNSKPAYERDIQFTKQVRITGNFKANLNTEGLRVLDIKAYDKAQRVIAHCWKAF